MLTLKLHGCYVYVSLQVSWCKVEVELTNAKGIKPAEPGSQLAAKPSPPLTVAALNLRTHTDPKTQQSEILAASVVHMPGGALLGWWWWGVEVGLEVGCWRFGA